MPLVNIVTLKCVICVGIPVGKDPLGQKEKKRKVCNLCENDMAECPDPGPAGLECDPAKAP